MSDEDLDDETYSVVRTVLGSTRRDERWHLTDELRMLTALGRARFDLRAAETTGHDVAEVHLLCVLGTVDLIVPVGTMVVLDGNSFLASASSRVADGGAVDLPRIEVTATTVLGRVRVRSVDEHSGEAVEAVVADSVPVVTDEVIDEAGSAAAAETPPVFVASEEPPSAVAGQESVDVFATPSPAPVAEESPDDVGDADDETAAAGIV